MHAVWLPGRVSVRTLSTVTLLLPGSNMQFLDLEETLGDEEDDVFGEGKWIFLAGVVLFCFNPPGNFPLWVHGLWGCPAGGAGWSSPATGSPLKEYGGGHQGPEWFRQISFGCLRSQD